MPVPPIPGREVESRRAYELTGRVAELCHMESKRYLPVALSSRFVSQYLRFWAAGGLQTLFYASQCIESYFFIARFPGSQPISFSKSDIARLENEESVRTCVLVSPL